ncbi:hypothetical protein [Parendozoicomonas haliclonae]|uniref:hypothetical protein n=1 Tax=Parendozoicomonas haliclonae TaxID=1960125 RepID=UPI001055521F|nr:hypothetical protein [Parendozoicomonas haliclonae]
MQFKELAPLVEKIECLKNTSDGSDIYLAITRKVESAKTPSMAQSVCEYIISMCHPRAWGDRDVSIFNDLSEWCKFLAELSNLATSCWNNISYNNGAKKLEN